MSEIKDEILKLESEIEELKNEISVLTGAYEAAEQDKNNLFATLGEASDEIMRYRDLLRRAFLYLEDISEVGSLLGTDIEDDIGFTKEEYDDIIWG